MDIVITILLAAVFGIIGSYGYVKTNGTNAFRKYREDLRQISDSALEQHEKISQDTQKKVDKCLSEIKTKDYGQDINSVNTKVENVLRDSDIIKRQQKQLSDLYEKMEKTVDTVYTANNDEFSKLHREIDSLRRDVDELKKKVAEQKISAPVPSTPNIPQDISATVQREVNAALQRELNAALQQNISAMVQREVNAALQQKISAVIQNSVNAAIPAIIQACMQQIPQHIKVDIPNITALESKLESKVADLQKQIDNFEPKPVIKEIPLKFDTESKWLAYKKKLDDIKELEDIAAENPVDLKSFGVTLKRFKTDLKKVNPDDFDAETTESVVDGIIKAAKNLVKALEDCNRAIKNPNKNSAPYEKLRGLIEKYFAGIGVTQKNFKAGDNYDAWADLGLTEQPSIESTDDATKYNTLKEIYVQPHCLSFIDEHGDKKQRVFGGKCAIYVRR